MLNYIDDLLDQITMYKLLLYYLIVLVLAAIGLSLSGALHFSAVAIAVSTIVLVVTCWVVNKVFAFVFEAPTNPESTHITALILALIIAPMTSYTLINFGFLLAAAGLAIASKYILTINKKHIFNPAAIAVVLTALGPRQSASWWVGTTALLPFVLIGGVLLTRKIRRGQLVYTFFASTLVATIIYSLVTHGSVPTSLHNTIMSSGMFFLGFVMLAEPLTTPPTVQGQRWYAALTGFLFPPQFHIFRLYSTPELALIGGNIFSYIISPKTKLFPTFKEKVRITPDSADLVFAPNHKFTYAPGQYMEWTLPHKNVDSRGARRNFTLASSPTEPDIRIGVKFYKKSSTFKETLLSIEPDTKVVAAQLSGDFVLPKDPKQKLVFIAGGIGITPYRSMIKYLIDKNETRQITLLYSAKTVEDFAYKDILEQARQKLSIKTIYFITDKQSSVNKEFIRSGYIDAESIRQEVPDYMEHRFYISGTHSMVVAMQDALNNLEVPRHHIKTDFFSGYA